MQMQVTDNQKRVSETTTDQKCLYTRKKIVDKSTLFRVTERLQFNNKIPFFATHQSG